MLLKTSGRERASFPSLKDKRVLVTGGASGIGEGLVEAFAAQGAQVAFVDIAVDAGQAVAERLSDAGHAPVFHRCDITDIDALERIIAEIMQAFGGVDVLLNNAANDDRHRLEDVTPAYWDDRLAVNLKHQFFAAKAVAPSMKANGGGAIVNFGSISWHLGLPDLALYQIAKAGIEGLTKSLARDLGRHNIRVNTIVPGNVKTPRQEKWYTAEGEAEIVAAQCLDGRIAPADIASMALFLASDDARFCTAHNYWVDAGWR